MAPSARPIRPATTLRANSTARNITGARSQKNSAALS